MADLALLEEEGFVELEDIDAEARGGACSADDLWDLACQADHAGARELLEQAGWDELPDPCQVIVLRVPDAAHGERVRVWVGPASF